MGGMAVGWRDEYVVIIFQFFLNINSVPLHEMELHKMTKDLALRPQYAQYPNPNPKPELFGQTRPEPDPKSKSPTRQGLMVTTMLVLNKHTSKQDKTGDVWLRRSTAYSIASYTIVAQLVVTIVMVMLTIFVLIKKRIFFTNWYLSNKD